MMRFWRGFFVAAGGFNVLGGLWGFVAYEDQFRRDGLPLPTYPFAFQLLFLSVVILGLAYLLVAYDPIRNRNLVWIGLLTKIAGLAMAYWAILDGQLPPSTWWQPLVRDLVWALGFAAFLGTTAGRRPLPYPAQPGRQNDQDQDPGVTGRPLLGVGERSAR